ncbi:hypothetical protein PHYBOEH_001425 [Phytophthora boehmeriae]|uniref:Uncharacterized protein n=1 Tax=Phytophthora boehmeriae TaxID=109152 RepID=A0A8T1XBL5_9STRA|nr:hypothetical protein PHYBOEH_001425 [Phytophthora boehmeriae]
MWVVDLGTCAIHMDDKPHHFPPLKRESSERNELEQQSDDAANRPVKRTRRAVDSSTTCAPEQLHCRYANKKCLNPRAVKRTGGLHTFCAMHRANANRNQRRLDMRKRMARQALRQQSLRDQTPTADAATDIDTLYEPLSMPTPLQQEDIATLVSLFLPPTPQSYEDATFGSQLRGSPPTTPDDWSPPNIKRELSESPPPPPGNMRF